MTHHIKSVTILHDIFPTTEHYPFTISAFTQTKQLTFETPVALFVGENGTGKSTLLEAIARASGIYIWGKPDRVRYQANQYENHLYRCLSLEWANGRVPGAFFGSDIYKNFADMLDEWAVSDPNQLKYFGGESLATKSSGQSVMSYFQARYRIKGVYLMDEPEAALSPKSQLKLLKIISENSRAGHAQFIIATHSPILLACVGAKIYSFDHVPVDVIDYEETEHYKIYRSFMLDRKKYL